VKALVWRGGRAIELECLDEPAPPKGEVVLEVELAGICGSDLHPYRGHSGPRVPPLVLGHEVVGKVGGMRYVVYPLIGCGACKHCLAGEENLCGEWRLLGMHRPGVFAQKVSIPRGSLVAVPDGLEPEAAALAEPLACCVGALRPHAVGSGTRLLVLGCGPIGLLAVFVAARDGAEVVAVDPLRRRRVHAKELGATRTLAAAKEIAPASQDLVVDAAGFEATWRSGIDAVQNGGTIVVVGLGQADGVIPMAAVVRRAINIRGQFAYSRADFARAIEILAARDLNLDWISEMPLQHGAQAFANLVDRPNEFSKVLLRP
jgi:threonine dehydrogenase-like Zn-dependent dehydrogenase